MALLSTVWVLCGSSMGAPANLLWEGQPSLRDLSHKAFVSGQLQSADPQPDFGAWPLGHAFLISNLAMRTTLWGTPDRITFSLMKNDVFDRRINRVHAPTLAEIRDGAFAPANKGLTNQGSPDSRRPASLGYLGREGGYRDPLRQSIRYPFPCPKPVGQIILGLDDFAGAEVSPVVQSCDDGKVTFTESQGERRARVEAVLGMTNNVYALRVTLPPRTPVTVRLYRHRDTSHQAYMDEEGHHYTLAAVEKDSAWNGPMPYPLSGTDQKDFWIRQDVPAERTFPRGEFHYVVAGRVLKGRVLSIATVRNKRHLGTPPSDPLIAKAVGSAATATVLPDQDGIVEVLVATVSSIDAADTLSEASRRLDRVASRGGFQYVESGNRDWFAQFYDHREEGRVFTDDASHPWPGESLPDIFRSWFCSHGGNTKPDMERLQASASYANPETDSQRWSGLPCYNEIFYTHRYVHHWEDSVDLWRKIVRHWRKGAEENARDTYGLPGMYLPHGYQPPTIGDRYYHTAAAFELCLGTAAQLLHPLWDEWDYGGDPKVLRSIYPPMKETAEFYAAYLTFGGDGLYHAIPSVAEENWGIWPRFSHNRDVTSAIAMIRWELNRAAEAAELLGLDSAKAKGWRQKAALLQGPWTWETPSGPVLTDVANVKPYRGKGEHPWDSALYPVSLADMITLGSPQPEREMALRTATNLPNASTLETRILTGNTAIRSDDDFGEPIAPGRTAEALLNSRDRVIRFFPGVDPKATVGFRHFQARDGFLVSASFEQGVVTHAEITAQRKIPCTFVSPWGSKEPWVKSGGEKILLHRGEATNSWVFDAEPKKVYLLTEGSL